MLDIVPSGAGVRVDAGALHPDRSGEEDWEPSYNAFRLTVTDTAPSPVAVEVWPRRLRGDATFGPLDPQEPVRTFSVVLDLLSSTEADSEDGGPAFVSSVDPPPSPVSVDERRLIRAFSALSVERRLSIGQHLGLLTEEDAGLDEPARARLVFHRARDRDRLEELAGRVDG